MSIDYTIFFIILACAIVTFIPRVLPFMIVRNMTLPKLVNKWLSFIPVCLFTALIMDSVLMEGEAFLLIDWPVLLALIPTLMIALWTKNLSITVIVGIICMAGVRQLF